MRVAVYCVLTLLGAIAAGLLLTGSKTMAAEQADAYKIQVINAPAVQKPEAKIVQLSQSQSTSKKLAGETAPEKNAVRTWDTVIVTEPVQKAPTPDQNKSDHDLAATPKAAKPAFPQVKATSEKSAKARPNSPAAKPDPAGQPNPAKMQNASNGPTHVNVQPPRMPAKPAVAKTKPKGLQKSQTANVGPAKPASAKAGVKSAEKKAVGKGNKSANSEKPKPVEMGESIITCVAGCLSARGEIVYQGKIRTIPPPPRPGVMLAKDGDASPGANDNVIECVAGCSGVPQRYQAVAPPPRPDRPILTGPAKTRQEAALGRKLPNAALARTPAAKQRISLLDRVLGN